MNLEEWIEARLAGHSTPLPDQLQKEFPLALAGHHALVHALEETLDTPEILDRAPPCLPSDYQIVGELGRGGMGVVYLARQQSLGREVAVKVLSPEVASRPHLVRRFLEEARHMAQVRHPHVVAVHEVGRAEGEPYFAMDYISGESLAGRLAKGPLTPTHAVALLKQVAEAIQHAHEQGIIHRDLKPGNVLIDTHGRALVTDFGLARDVSGASHLTRTGELLGTPAYMSPEQARGESDRISEATDVHALGALLYEMLTGKPPYGSDSPAAVFARLLREEPVPPRQLCRTLHPDLETICLKALAKSPDERYASARALLEDLRRYEMGEPILARRPGLLIHAGRFFRRQWRLLATAGVTAAVVTGLVLFLSDRSVADLRAWGKEREGRGEYAGAIEVYQRAWKKARPSERGDIRADLIRCIREVRDAKVAVAAALLLLPEASEVSFGPHDYLIAQALVAELKSRQSSGAIAEANLEERKSLELARKRLRLFLDSGEGTEAQRQSAEENLASIAHVLAGKPHTSQRIEKSTPQDLGIPTGTLDELRSLFSQKDRHPWERGKTAFALARRADNPHRRRDAAEAFELLRSVFPMYSGVASSTVISPTSGSRIGTEAIECRLLREAHQLARELDPKRPDTLRGEILFRIRGVELPEEVALNLSLYLSETPSSTTQTSFRPHRSVPFQNGEAPVGVADGTYHLKLQGTQLSYPSEQTRLARLLELDLDRVPNRVRLEGKRIVVSIPARMLTELTLRGPKPGAAHDPTSDFLRWEEVKGAAYYRVKLSLQQDRKDARTITSLPDVKVKTPRVCLGALEDSQAAARMAKLQPGSIATWMVEAFDKDDRRIATSVETARPFLITRSEGGN